MRQSQRRRLMVLALAMVTLLGLAVGVGFAQRPPEPPLRVELSLMPGETSVGDRMLGGIIVRNGTSDRVIFDQVFCELPPGLAYVGQAVGSELTEPAQVQGAQLRWMGPFALPPGGELRVGFWTMVTEKALPGEHSASVLVIADEQVVARSETAFVLQPRPEPAADLAPSTRPAEPRAEGQDVTRPEAVRVGKTVDPEFAQPGNSVLYTVVFTNTGDAVVLDSITDLLPVPFEYAGLAVGSEVAEEPTDAAAPEIVWTGAFQVPRNGTLTLRYWAWVPQTTPITPAPYSNRVTARYGTSTVGPASADVTAKGPEIVIEKTAWPPMVLSGDPVTYTVTFRNDGTGDGVIEVISDTLPEGFRLLSMEAGSDITQLPVGTAGTVAWNLPLTVPVDATRTLIYQAETAFVSGIETPSNEVMAVVDGQVVGPASASVRVRPHSIFLPLVPRDYDQARFTIAKSAAPTEVDAGEPVTYTVRVRNEGDVLGTLSAVVDDLPAGFSFLSMVSGSHVTSPPSGTSGRLTWNGPFNVSPHSELVLIYKVRAAEASGTFENVATAIPTTGLAPRTPATASVTVGPVTYFFDDFEDGIDEWTAFVNSSRLHEEQWSWGIGAGYNGSNGYSHYWAAGAPRPDKGSTDALTMYLGEGSEQWTNYRVSVRFNVHGGRQAGLWIRGQYEEVEKKNGQWVTGYYFTVRLHEQERDTAKIWQLRTEEEHGDQLQEQYWYTFADPMVLQTAAIDTPVDYNEWHQLTVEAEGNYFKFYVDDELAMEFVDDQGSIFLEGTVGLFAYGSEGNYAVIDFDDMLVEPLD